MGATLTAVSALTLLMAPLGYNLGVLSLRVALLTVLQWGAYGAAAGAVLSLLGLGITLVRPERAKRDLVVVIASVVAAAFLLGIPARYRLGPAVPPIHDITTDTVDPPQFMAVVSLNTPGRTIYEGEEIASQQRAAYPDLAPVRLALPIGQAFDHALATVHAMGWELVEANAESGHIEATDTTFWFRFKDDVAIRIRRPEGSGSRIDIRSLSRVGGGDAGTNAKRIRAYMTRLMDQSGRHAPPRHDRQCTRAAGHQNRSPVPLQWPARPSRALPEIDVCAVLAGERTSAM